MRSTITSVLVILSTVAGISGAQSRETAKGDLLLRANAPLNIGEGDSASTVVVIAGDADVRGAVTENLIVLGGQARITGRVARDILVTRGVLELAPTARVGGNVVLYQSELRRDPGAFVGGTVQTRQAPAFGQWLAFGFWLSMTVAIVAFGLLFAAVAPRQLSTTVEILTKRPGMAALSALIAWGSATVIVVVAMASVVGIPLGIGVAFFLMPALAFCGYVVTGAAVGARVLRRQHETAERRYAAVALGIGILQAVGFIPAIGALAVFVAALMGAGALVYRAFLRLRRGPQAVTATGPASQAA